MFDFVCSEPRRATLPLAKALFFVLMGLLMMIGESKGQRAVPDDNLAYPVLVTVGASQGSGYYLNTPQTSWFVTSKHVLFNLQTGALLAPSARLQSFSRDLTDPDSNITDIDLPVVQASGLLKAHKSEDVVVVKIGTIEKVGNQSRVTSVVGIKFVATTKEGITAIDKASMRKLDQVQISNDVYVFGFPNSVGLAQIPQLDQTQPLLRKGIVAGINRRQKTIIIDCQVFPGNSGGLVIQTQNDGHQFMLYTIGVVSQYVPFDNARFGLPLNSPTVLNSGYSIVTPMDAVLELID